MFLLQPHGLRQALSHGEDQGHNVFRHHWAVNFPGVSEEDVAVDQRRKHELMDGSRRGMNPAQLASGLELFGPERPCDGHLSIAEIIFNSIVTG